MTICELIDYARFLLDKEQKTNVVTPRQFNLVLKDVNLELFNFWMAKYNPGSTVPDALNPFLVSVSGGTISGGLYDIPTDFAAIAVDAGSVTIGGSRKQLQFVTSSFLEKIRSYPGANLAEYPKAVLESGKIKILPTNASDLFWAYFKAPSNPVYDYYIDANLNEICLSPGVPHTLVEGEVGSGGETLAEILSKTVEIEWQDRFHTEFVTRVMEKLGINTREADLFQFSQMKKQEEIPVK